MCFFVSSKRLWRFFATGMLIKKINENVSRLVKALMILLVKSTNLIKRSNN